MSDATISRARDAIWRVWAAPGPTTGLAAGRPTRPLRVLRPSSMQGASATSWSRAPERPAHAPRRATSRHRSSAP